MPGAEVPRGASATIEYTNIATSRTPALIIYLLDASGSMDDPCSRHDPRKKIQIVSDALRLVLHQMVKRSTANARIVPRYRIAMFAYNTRVHDLLDGIHGIDEVSNWGVPILTASNETNTTQGFLEVLRLLEQAIPTLPENTPAPLVCHMSDGQHNRGDDPEAVVDHIRALRVPDGRVLVENIFIAGGMVKREPRRWQNWAGVQRETELHDPYAQKLFRMSSPLPETYRQFIARQDGYRFGSEARMLFPGNHAQLIEMAFAISGRTPTY